MPLFKPVVTADGQHMYDNYHFSQAVQTEEFLLCSGVIGTNSDGLIPVDRIEEFRNAWNAIGTLLAEAELNYDNIVEYTSFHVGLQENMGKFMSIRNEFLSEPWPAWTAIGITELAVPGARVEIRVVARRG